MAITPKPAMLDSGGVKYQTAAFFARLGEAPIAITGTNILVPDGPDSRVIVSQDPVLGFAFQPGNAHLHSIGTGSTRPSQFPSGMTGSSVDGSVDRIVRVADPDNGAKWAYKTRANSADTLTFNGRRAEFSYDDRDSRVGDGTRVLIGAMLRFPDWTGVPTGDKLLVMQMHGKADIQPWLSFNWDGPRFYARFTRGSALVPDNVEGDANATEVDITWAANTWMRIAIEVTAGASGRLRVLINGTPIIEYTGHIGFLENYNYLKLGIYKWPSGNVWTTTGALGTREMHLKGPYMIATPTEPAEQMDALLVARG